ncbi:bifunctional glycosyltransferase family 2 protein/CDP-glycerol:glycerophosphate glycerophosphotransferase [Escherichia coli]|nr:glycosyltransferase [Escherichia coli]ELS7787846.1 CDP-glycerol glycerophosphotransferase family protein [Escherichia coli]ELS7809370.1 CDP-glycerol glycerophosphotransferase family protein [Escherichia coli]MCN4841015.1 bifunctional glycosyltransferase family 2 protein/CDP-glycerol:glycerophosphate glycerophosphotransferase [Escherichia coli]MDF1379774.1 CDP-glycerol glycerophosphotransferase family protein [Escherichia coli]
MKLVTVIVPVYNVERYIEECIDSILTQSIDGIKCEDSIEIIFIDDGSPDSSSKIIQQYQEKYQNIFLISQENAGQSVARNNAINIASGEYIFFLDSDDLLPPNALSPLYKLAKETGSEVIVSHSKAFNSRRSWFVDDHAEVASAAFRKINFYHRSILVKTPAPWAKLYKRELLTRNDIKFPIGIKLAEDWIFVMKAMQKANHISSTPHISYLYRGRDDELNPSCTQIVNDKVFYDLIKVYELSLELSLPSTQTRIAKLFILRGILYRLAKYSQDNTIENCKPIYKAIHRFLHNYIDDQLLRIFTPARRLPLLLIYNEFYSEAHRTLNNKFKRTCLKKGLYLKDHDIINDYKKLKHDKFKKPLKRYKNKCIQLASYAAWLAKYKTAKIISPLYKDKEKEIALIGERLGNTANDSSYHLFSYINSNNTAQKSKHKYYYVIKKNAKTKSNLSKFSNVVNYGSMKHFALFHAAEKYIFSDSMRDVFHHWQRISDAHAHKPRIFLQHGIFATSRAKGYYDKNSMLRRGELPNKFIVSSELEKTLVCRQFGFNSEEIAITGLARFDKLQVKKNNRLSKTILLLPTWRDWLSDVSEEKFIKSQYFNKIHSLITNEGLNNLLLDKNYRLVVCLHHKMHKHVKNISVRSSQFDIFSMNDIDIQPLIADADLMITDYSSASFDILYQNKPVLYYWFDSQQFFATRGGPLICPLKDFPGPISSTEDELISQLRMHIDNNCIPQAKYAKLAKRFFKYKDNKNSKRIFDVIEGIQ